MEEKYLIPPLDKSLARTCIQQRLPDLQIHTIQYLGGGSHSVFDVNSEWIFRFPKAAEVAANYPREECLLRRLVPYLQPHRIPNPRYLPVSCNIFPLPISMHRKLPGIQASPTDPKQKHRFALLLGDFLAKLHTIPPGTLFEKICSIPDFSSVLSSWEDYFRRMADLVFPILAQPEIQKFMLLFNQFREELTCHPFQISAVHGDLNAENILITPVPTHLQVIDFEDMSPGDPAADFCLLTSDYGPEFLDRVLQAYGLPQGPGFFTRMNFYYRRIPLIYLEYGLLHQNNAFIEYGKNLIPKCLFH